MFYRGVVGYRCRCNQASLVSAIGFSQKKKKDMFAGTHLLAQWINVGEISKKKL
jgi:hypothetical protein